MRIYYVFNINNYFSYIYKNNNYKMFKLLEEIYYTKEYDMVLSYKYFEQVASTLNKNKLNEYIYNSLSICSDYYNKINSHIVSNNNEYSKLVITNTSIKIKTNIDYPIFFEILKDYQDNIFIVDFINKKYFWLEKNRQIDKNLVK